MDQESVLRLSTSERAVVQSGKNVIFVSPPAEWAVEPLFRELPGFDSDGLNGVFLVPQVSDLLAVSEMANRFESFSPVHPVTGIARTRRLLRRRCLKTLVATPADTMQLLSASALKSSEIRRTIIYRADLQITLGQSDNLDSILSELSGAQRVILTTREDVVADLIARHARRSPVIRPYSMADVVSGKVRYLVADRSNRQSVARECFDSLDPDSVLLWDPEQGKDSRWVQLAADQCIRVSAKAEGPPVDLALATCLPDAATLAALILMSKEVVVMLRSGQLDYLESITEKLRPLKLPSESDRARDRAFQLRNHIRDQIEGKGDLSFELSALEPLFYEHDPALVAAAAISAVKAAQAEKPADKPPTWVKIFVSAGKKDGVRPTDLVGLLCNTGGITKQSVGRVDIRETFTLVEVSEHEANRAIRALSGETIRGRRISARLDRK